MVCAMRISIGSSNSILDILVYTVPDARRLFERADGEETDISNARQLHSAIDALSTNSKDY